MEILDKLLSRQSLSFEEARLLLQQIHEDRFTDEQLRQMLTAFQQKGETVEEIAAFASVVRESAIPFSASAPILVDTAGTGGDGLHTFNISTTAAFVIAGADIPVAKHGNRAVSSRTGSADVLAALGVDIDLPPADVERCLKEAGMAFLFAPSFHRATARVAKIRREMGSRTIFNLLGPLTNPAQVKHQVIGVCSRSLAMQIAAVCERLGSQHVWVVSSDDGADELSISARNFVREYRYGEFDQFEIVPEEYGFERGRIEDLQGGDANQNATILKSILLGEDQSSRRDTVMLNAAAGIYVSGVGSFEEALHRAQDSLDEGAAYHKLQQLIQTTQKLKNSSTNPG